MNAELTFWLPGDIGELLFVEFAMPSVTGVGTGADVKLPVELLCAVNVIDGLVTPEGLVAHKHPDEKTPQTTWSPGWPGGCVQLTW